MRCLRRPTSKFWINRFNDWGMEEEKLLWFVGETEMDDLGVVGILGPENFEQQKESCEAEFVKELDLNE